MSGIAIGTMEVRVEPSVMRKQAYETERLATSLRQRFDSIEKLVNATKEHWTGEAGELHRRLYDEQKEELAEALLRLKEHPKDLLVMAGLYEEAEMRNSEDSAALRENVIV